MQWRMHVHRARRVARLGFARRARTTAMDAGALVSMVLFTLARRWPNDSCSCAYMSLIVDFTACEPPRSTSSSEIRDFCMGGQNKGSFKASPKGDCVGVRFRLLPSSAPLKCKGYPLIASSRMTALCTHRRSHCKVQGPSQLVATVTVSINTCWQPLCRCETAACSQRTHH